VRIGNQIWIAENLNYDTESGNMCYDNDPANCEIYGRLYYWATAMALPSSCNSSDCASQVQAEHQGICPSGWHLPSRDEFRDLFYYNKPATLKARSGWNNNGNGNDYYGFAALPGGAGGSSGNSDYAGTEAFWWSSTDLDGYYAACTNIRAGNSEGRNNGNKIHELFSIRCLQAAPPINLETFTDDRDGKTYKWVRIGTQVWMAENLDYETGSRCYGNDPANCEIYGRLYDWATAMALPNSCNSYDCTSQVQARHQGICPSGWHLPSDAEWQRLVDFIGDEILAGGKLKATSGWGNSNGIDFYGFAALPSRSNVAAWWSSTESNTYNKWIREIQSGDGIFRFTNDPGGSLSVRCLRN
jgi:uncharacterized protein (TIGR02145 family)